MDFSRQEYWSGLPFPSPGDIPDPGIKPGSPGLQADSLPSEPPGKSQTTFTLGKMHLFYRSEIEIHKCSNDPSKAVQIPLDWYCTWADCWADRTYCVPYGFSGSFFCKFLSHILYLVTKLQGPRGGQDHGRDPVPRLLLLPPAAVLLLFF